MDLILQNQTRWNSCHVSANKGPTFDAVAKRLLASAAKARYQSVEKRTGVPWWFIAVVHEREASQNWNTQLGQGDPLNKKSVHVPKGRGPFTGPTAWEDAAVDALTKCAPFAAKNTDWSPGGALTMLEKYNGLGYANKGRPSPYIWAGTDQYVSGKYVADGVYDPNKVDTQLGCAGLLKFMNVFNKGIPTGSATTTVAIAGGSAIYKYWHLFQEHWIAYTAGLLLTGFLLDLAIHLYKNRKTNG